ncbi:hypothetical protein [Synechococcus phage DSL-LC03]|nr:hypothetical protein [Synechococcus phage DSL-LC03]
MNYINSIINGNTYNIKQFGKLPSTTLEKLEELVPDEILSSYKNTDYYRKIKHLIETVEITGTLYRSSGHCIGISDMIKKLLEDYGIKSKLIECNLSIIQPDSISLIGYQDGIDLNPKSEVATHVVCVTETPVPLLIDLSISDISKTINYIVHPLHEKFIEHDKNIVTIKFDNNTWSYNQRQQNILIDLHEKSIIDRINKDIQVDLKLDKLTKIIICTTVLVSLNLLRGTYDFYQKYINKTNGFGPHKTLIK